MSVAIVVHFTEPASVILRPGSPTTRGHCQPVPSLSRISPLCPGMHLSNPRRRGTTHRLFAWSALHHHLHHQCHKSNLPLGQLSTHTFKLWPGTSDAAKKPTSHLSQAALITIIISLGPKRYTKGEGTEPFSEPAKRPRRLKNCCHFPESHRIGSDCTALGNKTLMKRFLIGIRGGRSLVAPPAQA